VKQSNPGNFDRYGVFTPFAFLFEHFSVDFGEQLSFPINAVKKLEHFEQKKEYAVFCPVGQTSFAEVSEWISRVVLRCRKQKIEKLLIDSTGVSGFHPPGIAERYNFVERISANAKSSVKIAHVASPEWVRSGEFAVTVAKNRGLDAKNFHTEPEALKWLLTPARKLSDKPTNPAF